MQVFKGQGLRTTHRCRIRFPGTYSAPRYLHIRNPVRAPSIDTDLLTGRLGCRQILLRGRIRSMTDMAHIARLRLGPNHHQQGQIPQRHNHRIHLHPYLHTRCLDWDWNREYRTRHPRLYRATEPLHILWVCKSRKCMGHHWHTPHWTTHSRTGLSWHRTSPQCKQLHHHRK